ncbi:MAG: hypothetical protein QXT81_04435 [Candidatus Bathyarchaeia archaeon]
MLGTCIAFSGKLTENDYGKKVGEVTIKMPNGEVLERDVEYGTIQRIKLNEGEVAEVEIRPSSPFRVSAQTGVGRKFTTNVDGGVVGILIDARGRPIDLPQGDELRHKKLREWFSALEAYPIETLDKL